MEFNLALKNNNLGLFHKKMIELYTTTVREKSDSEKYHVFCLYKSVLYIICVTPNV